jgi:integrase
MAWLERHPTSGRYKVCFRWAGRQFKKTVRTTDPHEAEAVLRRVEETIGLAERGRLDVPPGADVATFFVSDGKLDRKPAAGPPPKPLTLAGLRDLYVTAHAQGAVEQNTLQTARMHLGHVIDTLGVSYPIQGLTRDDLQRHVDRRARKVCRGRPLSPVTLRKELATLRACWNWAGRAGKLTGPFPNRGLTFPKAAEKPPFQTWDQVTRRIARGGLSKAEQDDLWECVFLPLPRIGELLGHVKRAALQPFVYPMFVFAAHTGARRSEMLRVRVDDLDLEAPAVLLREKKRVRGTRTTRRVPLSPLLAAVLREWLEAHPGGQYLFCQPGEVTRSKTRRSGPAPITRDQAHDHLRRTLAGSPWGVLRGWHVFRHSFCSNCAAAGVDQRLIDAWVGHTTEEMRRRYRHLLPTQECRAIQAVFGDVTAAGSPSEPGVARETA